MKPLEGTISYPTVLAKQNRYITGHERKLILLSLNMDDRMAKLKISKPI
jgi:hypothetical protein